MLPKSDWTSVALGTFALAPTEDGRWRRRRRRRAPSSRIVWHGMACRLALSHIHRHDESRTTTDTTDREEVPCSHNNHQSANINHPVITIIIIMIIIIRITSSSDRVWLCYLALSIGLPCWLSRIMRGLKRAGCASFLLRDRQSSMHQPWRVLCRN